MSFTLNLKRLPAPQLAIWPELRAIPPSFVLYGGTGLALRLGHRQSVDFDFFSSQPFFPDDLTRRVSFLAEGERLQSEPNTLSVSLERGGPVKLSFFGALTIGRVGTPDQALDNSILVASLLDLAGTKMAAVQQRAEKKDYLDIHAILEAGVSLEEALGAAQAIYGPQFNPAITLKALSWFQDGDLPSLSKEVQDYLTQRAVRVRQIKQLQRLSDCLGSA
jgi:hypothetical protein